MNGRIKEDSMEKKDISVYPYDGAEAFGIRVTEPCHTCHHEVTGDQYRIELDAYCGMKEDVKVVLCKDCLAKLHEEIGRALHKSVRTGDTVYELTLCDDGVWRVFPMVVKSVREFGSVRWVEGKEPTVWNIYCESKEYTYMYKNFYEEGKTWFVNEADAMAALEEKTREKSEK